MPPINRIREAHKIPRTMRFFCHKTDNTHCNWSVPPETVRDREREREGYCNLLIKLSVRFGMQWEQDAWSSWNICMDDRIHGRSHSRRWSNYKGNWLQFPTTKGPACQPACPDSEFKLIRHTDFDTLNAIIWQQDENIFIHCVLTMQYVLSLSLSLAQSLFIAATPPQSVANAPDAKAALSLRLSLFLFPSSRFVS